MKPELFQEVALNRTIRSAKLHKGDVAVVIDYLPHPSDGEEGALLEIFNAVGESIRVEVVPISAIEPLRADQMLAVRSLAA